MALPIDLTFKLSGGFLERFQVHDVLTLEGKGIRAEFDTRSGGRKYLVFRSASKGSLLIEILIQRLGETSVPGWWGGEVTLSGAHRLAMALLAERWIVKRAEFSTVGSVSRRSLQAAIERAEAGTARYWPDQIDG